METAAQRVETKAPCSRRTADFSFTLELVQPFLSDHRRPRHQFVLRQTSLCEGVAVANGIERSDSLFVRDPQQQRTTESRIERARNQQASRRFQLPQVRTMFVHVRCDVVEWPTIADDGDGIHDE